MKCYDQEKSGFFSLRLSSNKHFGHNIGLVDSTQAEGTAEFVMKYCHSNDKEKVVRKEWGYY